MNEVTTILSSVEAGDPRAAADLLPLVYDELRQLAAARLAAEPSGKPCSRPLWFTKPTSDWLGHPTAITGTIAAISSPPRPRPFAASWWRMPGARSGTSMAATGDGSRWKRPSRWLQASSEDLPALDEALTRLAAHDPIKAEVVKLRFFAGLTMPEVAQVAGHFAGNC